MHLPYEQCAGRHVFWLLDGSSLSSQRSRWLSRLAMVFMTPCLIAYLGVSRIDCFRRLFIVDGVISLPIALTGFWLLPDVPEIAKPWYLTEKVNITHSSIELFDHDLSNTSTGSGYCAETNGAGRSRREKQVYSRQDQAHFCLVAYLWPHSPLCVSSTTIIASTEHVLIATNSFWINSVIGSAAPAFQL